MSVMINVSFGELIDKVSILEIKKERISDPEKLENVQRELDLLQAIRSSHIQASEAVDQLYKELRSVNELLWDIEDDIREHERNNNFDSRFIELARSVYITNDRRCELKRELDKYLGSDITEEKSYQPY